MNDFFPSSNPGNRGLGDYSSGLLGIGSPGLGVSGLNSFSLNNNSSFSNRNEGGQGALFNPFADLSGFGLGGGIGGIGGGIGGIGINSHQSSRLPISMLRDDHDDEEDVNEGDYAADFHMKMITDDDEDDKVEVSLGAYRSGKLTFEKVRAVTNIDL